MRLSRQHLCAAAVVVGLLLVILSLVWPLLRDSQSAWTSEDAKEYEETVARVHAGEQLTDRGKQLESKLESARRRPDRVARVLKWSGAGLVALGAVGLLLRRQPDK